MKPVGGIGSQWRDGCADRRWRHRAGEGALGSLLEGSNGILAFGQVVERLPSSPTCSPPRCPAHCSTYGRPQLILNLSIACPSCSGTQSGPAAGGGPASAGESPPMWSGRWTQRLGYTHTFDIEQYLNSGKMRHVARMSSLYVLGAVRARIRKGPIHRGDRIERDGRGVCSVTVLQHLVLHSELHVSPGGVEFRLAPVLPLLHALPQSRARSGADHWQPVPDSDAEVARIRS